MRFIAITSVMMIIFVLLISGAMHLERTAYLEPSCVYYSDNTRHPYPYYPFRVDLRSGAVTEAKSQWEPVPLEKGVFPGQEYYGPFHFHNFESLEGIWVNLRGPVPPQLLARQAGNFPFGMKPAYSPDGQHIAVPWDDFSSSVSFHISVTDRNGYNPVTFFSTGVAKFPPTLVGWSADGNYFAVRGYSMEYWSDYYFVRTDNGTFTDVAHAIMPRFAKGLVAESVAWSPHGHVFAAITVGPPHTLTLATPAEGILTSNNLPSYAEDYPIGLKWSADGNYVSASYYRTEPNGTVRRVHTILKVQGNFITELQGGRFHLPDSDALRSVNYWIGNRFVFGRYNSATSVYDLVAFDPDTNQYSTLATGIISADYNEDNHYLVFETAHKDGLALTLMNADGSHQMTLVQGAARIRPARWWGHNGLTISWDQSSDNKNPLAHLTWATVDGPYTGTSSPTDEIYDQLWLPDAPYLFYFSRIYHTVSIHAVELLTGNDYGPIQVSWQGHGHPETFVALSPAQDSVVIQYAAEIYVLSLQTGLRIRINRIVNAPFGAIWSPDGSQFAVVEQDSTGKQTWLDAFTPQGDLLHRVLLSSSSGSIEPISYTYCP